MSPWLRPLEEFLVRALLQTPGFHRGVEKVAKTVHRLRHGLPPEEMGGTKIDSPSQSPTFAKNFYDEIRTQLGAAESRDAARTGSVQSAASKHPAPPVEETSDKAWQNAQRNASQPPKQSFMAEYVDALREQMRNGKNER